MFAYIEGKLVQKDPATAVIDVNGVGYEIRISLNTYSLLKENDKCKLFTWLHVKEDAHTLFGFENLKEKKLFIDLISVSGIGPGTALTFLSSLNVTEIAKAIVNEDVRTIQSIKGIGAKTAQRVILELKDKLKKDGLAEKEEVMAGGSHNTVRSEALSALVALGINKAVAEKSVDTVLKSNQTSLTVEELIKLSLKTS